MDDAPRQQKPDQAERERVIRCRKAAQVKFKSPQHRAHHHALQAIGAAGEPVELVCQFIEDQRHAERHHQPCQVAAAQNGEAADKTERGGEHGGEYQPERRVRHDMFGKQRCGVGPKPEKRRVAERDDAGVSQHQIERHREQRDDRNLVHHQGMARRQHRRGEHQYQYDEFPCSRM